jgi:chromosome segregation ATPase
MIPLFKI